VPGDKLPAKKSSAASKAGAAREGAPAQGPSDERRPKSAAEVVADTGEETTTPAGTTAATEGFNPETGDTSLSQPGTEPVVDPAAAKRVASKSNQLRKAAETPGE
jgi:hypothetical protein